MAVAYLHEFSGATHEHAQQFAAKLEAQGEMPPAGGLFHAEGPTDGGWWALDIWDSEGSARAFYDGRMAPIVRELGLPEASPRVLAVHWHSNQPQGE